MTSEITLGYLDNYQVGHLPTFYFDKFGRTQYQSFRVLLNAMLNTNGGQVFFGLNSNQQVEGVLINQSQRDTIRLSLDSFVNAFQPQVDNLCINATFYKVNRPTKDSLRSYWMVEIIVNPGQAKVYFTSSAQAEAFVLNNNQQVQLLSNDQIIARHNFDRSACLYQECTSLEISNQDMVINRALEFVHSAKKPTRIISFYGMKCSGKSRLMKQVALQLHYDVVIDIDFKRYLFINDIYKLIINTINPSIKIKQFHMQNLIPIKTIIESEPDIEALLRDSQQEITRCSILQNICFNEMLAKNREDIKFLLIFDNTPPGILDLLNLGSASTYLIGTRQQIQLSNGPGVDFIELECQQLTSEDLTKLCGKKINIEQANRLLQIFEYDIEKIVNIVSQHSGEIVDQISTLEKQQLLKSFYIDNIPEDAETFLQQLCIVPGKFSVNFIVFMIKDFQMEMIIRFRKYLFCKDGYYSIDLQTRQLLLKKMDESIILVLQNKLVDFIIVELADLNKKYQLQYKGKAAKGEATEKFHILMNINSRYISEWLVQHSKLLVTGVKLALQKRYKLQELYNQLDPTFVKRLPSQLNGAILEIQEILGVPSSSDVYE